MKTNRPEISSNWWSAVKPDHVDTKNDFEKALVKAEQLLGDQQRNSEDARAADKCLGALKKLLIAKVIKECDRRNDKDLLAGLKQLQGMVNEEITRLEEIKKNLKAGKQDKDEEEDEGKIFEKDYVHKLIKQVKSGGKELHFAFGLDMNSPERCRLLLHRKKSGERLWKALKKTKKFPNRLMCYGRAVSDPNDRQTLLLRLSPSSNIPPKRIFRTARKLFRADRKLRFKKLAVVTSNGKVLADKQPSDATAGQSPAT